VGQPGLFVPHPADGEIQLAGLRSIQLSKIGTTTAYSGVDGAPTGAAISRQIECPVESICPVEMLRAMSGHVAVRVGVAVRVRVAVEVCVGVSVFVAVGVGLNVAALVTVGVCVGVAVRV
jgi:hypothetical protein